MKFDEVLLIVVTFGTIVVELFSLVLFAKATLADVPLAAVRFCSPFNSSELL